MATLLTVTPVVLDEAIAVVAAHLPPRLRQAVDWQTSDEDSLWRELIASILGSAVSFEQAYRALSALDAGGLTSPPTEQNIYQAQLLTCLQRVGYRFPVSRSSHIAETAQRIYGTKRTLRTLLLEYSDPMAARRHLISLCLGLGPKQASLFLRNIGYKDFAVLDRHLLSYLRFMRLIDENIYTASSLVKYERLEQLAEENALRLSLSLAEFDLAVWVTMRALNGASARWVS